VTSAASDVAKLAVFPGCTWSARALKQRGFTTGHGIVARIFAWVSAITDILAALVASDATSKGIFRAIRESARF
jgi:hypothetical protein